MKADYNFYVYIMASKSRVLYVGMTNDIVERVRQHKFALVEGFTSRYRCARLLYFERFQYVGNCINREKELKSWRREKKIALSQAANPIWADFAADWYLADGALNVNSRSLASLGMTNWRDEKVFAEIKCADINAKSTGAASERAVNQAVAYQSNRDGGRQ